MSLGIRLIAKCKKLSGLFMGVKDARKLAIGDEKLLSPNRISLATQDWWLKLANHPAMTDRIVHVIDANLWWLQPVKSADSTDFAELADCSGR